MSCSAAAGMPLRWVVAGLATAAVAATSADTDAADQRIAATLGGIGDFLWGTATASYQVEGAFQKDGRQQSIWDVFAHTPGKVHANDTGDYADDFYNRYESDIQRVKDYGFNAFRYSFAWTRIYPKGEDGKHHVNPKGIEYYKNVTSSVLAKGLTPIVTLFHWDLPDDLDWLNESVVPGFVEYVDVVWKNFPEVKHWATFNEPLTFCELGYGIGIHAPGIKSDYKKFICGHNVLLAHSEAVALYRKTYLQKDQATVGIVLNYDWTWPLNASDPNDIKAAECCHDFGLGWFADPVYLTGDYPRCMRERLGDNLPNFTDAQSAALKGSVIGPYLQNTYSGRYAQWDGSQIQGFKNTFRDANGFLIGPQADSGWLCVVPLALRRLLEYIHKRYTPSAIIVTENGCDVPGENDMPLEWALNDTFRVDFYRAYLDQAAAAVRESGVPLKGYIAWSLEDNFEWADGYAFRFGITYVNYTTQQRYPKASAKWFTHVLGLRAAQLPGGESGRSLPAWVWLFFVALAAPFLALGFMYAMAKPRRRGSRAVVGLQRGSPAEGQQQELNGKMGGSPLLPQDALWLAGAAQPVAAAGQMPRVAPGYIPGPAVLHAPARYVAVPAAGPTQRVHG